MKMLAAIISAISVYLVLFSAPFDIPFNFLPKIGFPISGKSTQLKKECFIKCAIILVLFYIISRIQGIIMGAILPERAMAINEITQTILSGQDYNAFFVVLKIIQAGGFGAVSFKGFLLTIILNFVYILILTGIVLSFNCLKKNDLLKSDRIVAIFGDHGFIEPFNTTIITLIGLVSITAVYYTTGDSSEPFFHVILRNLWSFIDKVQLTSAAGSIIGIALPVDIGIVITSATRIRNIYDRPGKIDL